VTYVFSRKIPGWPHRRPPQRDDNDETSGGLPHSEITGSKPIPGSPVLIAGYHVLHRLLLPRHPPNALLALDPIQRRTGLVPAFCCPAHPSSTPSRRSPGRKSYSFPPRDRVRPQDIRLVYLTWNKTAAGRLTAPRSPPHSGEPAVLMFLFLHDCQTRPDRTRQRPAALADPIPEQIGGAYRDRTDDPLLAKQMLSQLS
jgi:hypothetical protein